jgi:hypothetical protein
VEAFINDVTIESFNRPGDYLHAAILTEEQVLEIRQKHSQKAKQNALAKEYNVSTACISNIISRKTWKHI